MREVGNFFFLTSSQLWWLYLGAQIVWKMWERNINCKHGTALLSQPTLFIIEIKNACILCFRSDLILTLPGKQLPIPTVFLKQTKVGLIYSESQINHILYNTHTQPQVTNTWHTRLNIHRNGRLSLRVNYSSWPINESTNKKNFF